MRSAGEGGGAQVRRCAWTRTLAHDAAIGGNLRRWITGEGSLTARLIAASARFRVTRLAQGMEVPLLDEWRTIDLAIPRPVIARDVLLICDDTPAIYAHSIVHPLQARRDWPFLGGLGERPLGGALFVDPRVRREPFEFARLLPHHPLMRRLQVVLPELAQSAMLPARRSVFRRGQGAMLVTEVFLPDLARRKAPPAEAGSAAGLPMPERPARPGR